MPGTSTALPNWVRPVGIVLSTSGPITVCCRAFCTSTTGDSPVTVMVSFSCADAHVGVDRGRERAGQLDAVALEGVEAGNREGDRVGPRPQVDDLVLSAAVGDDAADLLDQRGARGFDSHARQHRSGRVAGDTFDGRLRERGRRQERWIRTTAKSNALRIPMSLCSYRRRDGSRIGAFGSSPHQLPQQRHRRWPWGVRLDGFVERRSWRNVQRRLVVHRLLPHARLGLHVEPGALARPAAG